MGKTLVISNLKGGCGKSFTAASLGVGLARQGKKVLCIDTDSQHSLTVSFGIKEPENLPVTLASIMANIISETDYDPTEGIIHHAEGVDLLPSNLTLANTELTLVSVMGRETVLRQYIEKVKPLYDWIIADTSPSLGLLTMVDRRANFTREIISLIESAYGSNIRIFDEHIPLSVRAAETSATGNSIFTHDPRGKVAAAYEALVRGVLDVA
jgi:chromosome partitioning protein